MSKPFFSIIVPTYNRAHLITPTILSLQKQQYDQYEIIIVDDGSTDNTEEVVSNIADARTLYYKKENAERAAARNFGGRMAKGDYLNFFDSDDLALENHLSEAAKMVAENKSPEWFHLGFAWATPEGKIFRRIDNFRGDTLNHLFMEGNPLGVAGVFLRKDIFDGLPFIEDRALAASEDYELWVRMAARYPLPYTNTVTSLLVDHEDRSVRTMQADKLITRLNSLVHYLGKDPAVREKFKKRFHYLVAEADFYIALHLAPFKRFKANSIRYLFKAIGNDPFVLGKRRMLATLRDLVFKWYK
jgi:glycosyltransferase involved in cell wall biosynthesis